MSALYSRTLSAEKERRRGPDWPTAGSHAPEPVGKAAQDSSRCSLRLEADFGGVEQAARAAVNFGRACGLDSETLYRLELAVRELAANAVVHGCGYHPGNGENRETQPTATEEEGKSRRSRERKSIALRLEQRRGQLRVELRDPGPGLTPADPIDPGQIDQSATAPAAETALWQPHGRGLAMASFAVGPLHFTRLRRGCAVGFSLALPLAGTRRQQEKPRER